MRELECNRALLTMALISGADVSMPAFELQEDPPSSLTRQMLRRRDVVQSPFTVVKVDLSVGDNRCCRKPHGSLRSFSVTGTIF